MSKLVMNTAPRVGDSVRFAYYDMQGVRPVVGVVTSRRFSEWMEVVATSDDGQYRAVLVSDGDCESPMDPTDYWVTSVLVSGVGWGSNYSNGDTYNDPEDRGSAWRHFDERGLDADAAFIRHMRLFHGIEVRQVNWGSDSDRALAWIEPCERERVGIPDHTPDAAVIESDVNEYNEWASGECYGYTVQERVTWRADVGGVEVTRETWEDTDESCWGFIGYRWAESEALATLNYLVNRDRS